MEDDIKLELKSNLEDAIDMLKNKPEEGVKSLKNIISHAESKQPLVDVREEAIKELVKFFASKGQIQDLKDLFVFVQSFFATIPKSTTAKIVRDMIDLVGEHADSSKAASFQADFCCDAVAWCEKEKRTFLKQRLQTKLSSLYLTLGQYKEALKLIARLLREVRRLDDKLLIVEISLIEARVHLALQNIPKAKGAMTAARSNANSIYCPPLLQAEIDLMAGILCSEEKDYKTAFSYFYESFEGYNTMKKPEKAIQALKYMLLGKIMTNNPEDVYSIINGKAGLKYAGPEMEAMRAVADAYKKRSIHAFEDVYKRFHAQLADDPLIKSRFTELKENLLEQNLLRLLEPFSRVQIEHVAELIKLPRAQIEQKLSEMILDKKLHGILDQGAGDLILYEQLQTDKTYTSAIKTVKELDNVVSQLFEKSELLK